MLTCGRNQRGGERVRGETSGYRCACSSREGDSNEATGPKASEEREKRRREGARACRVPEEGVARLLEPDDPGICRACRGAKGRNDVKDVATCRNRCQAAYLATATGSTGGEEKCTRGHTHRCAFRCGVGPGAEGGQAPRAWAAATCPPPAACSRPCGACCARASRAHPGRRCARSLCREGAGQRAGKNTRPQAQQKPPLVRELPSPPRSWSQRLTRHAADRRPCSSVPHR